MARRLYKGFLVVSLLHLCQGQDLTVPSPSPESALPSIVNVTDAVKAAFMEGIKVLSDDAVRAFFDQVVGLDPKENITQKPPATREDGLLAVMHEHAAKETTSLNEENVKQEQVDSKLNSAKHIIMLPNEDVRQGAGLIQEQDEKSLIHQINESDEHVQDLEGLDVNLEKYLVASTQEPKETTVECESLSNRKNAEFEKVSYFDSEGKQEEHAELYEGKLEKERKQKTDLLDESNIQEGEKLEWAEQTESQPDQNQYHGLVFNDSKLSIVVEVGQNKDVQRLVDSGEDVEEIVKEEVAGHIKEKSVGGDEETDDHTPVSKATEKTSQELDVMEETNDLNDIMTSRDPELKWEVSTPDFSDRARPPFPTLLVELGERDELMKEAAESNTPKQEAWKIGVTAIAFFLIMQTLVTVIYILKCRTKPNSCTVPERVCEDGTGTVEEDAVNADTDEETTASDLPEGSKIQQETFTMTLNHEVSMKGKTVNH